MKPLFMIRGVHYTTRSAGAKLLHSLAEKLIEKGEEVRMSPCNLRNGSSIKIIHDPSEIRGWKTVVVEPEIMSGEQPWADLVCRWLLNVPGKAGPDKSMTWGKNDSIFHLVPQFATKTSRPLTMPMIDHSIFHNENNPNDKNRKVDVFYARKAKAFGGYEIPDGDFFDISDENLSQEALADLFRQTRTFMTPELTACSVEALLCGAQNKFIPSKYLPVPPVDDYLAWHKAMEDNSDGDVENFIHYCYEKLGLRRESLVA